MDKDNFEYQIHSFHVVMSEGQLDINDAGYEEIEDDPTYTMAREIAKLRGLYE